MPNTKVIYTSLTKGYDDLRQPETVRPDYDFVCFSNDFTTQHVGVWQIRKITYINNSETRVTRYAKLNPHVVLPEYEYSIWVDANALITERLYCRADELIASNVICAMIKHPIRNCVYEEARYLIAYSIGESHLVYEQAKYIKEHNLPPNAGLYTCSIILRKHHDKDVVRFSSAWWIQYERFSCRDQMGVSYALSCAGLVPVEFMPSAFLSEVIIKHNPAKPTRLAKRIVRYSKGRFYLLRLRLLCCSCMNPIQKFMMLYRILHSAVARGLPDEWYLRLVYKRITGEVLHLNPPRTFNEKLQWLKLYDRRPIYTTLVDKYAVRKYIAAVLGEQYLIPLLGVWDRADDIDIKSLPDQFVLKATHDSGGVLLCHDKRRFDIPGAIDKLNQHLAQNFFEVSREWPYQDVPRRIIAEALLGTSDAAAPLDYKLMCFNGKVRCTFVCSDRGSESGLKVTFYDRNWIPLPFTRHYPSSQKPIPRPASYDEMVDIAERLSGTIPFCRIDLYEIKGRIFFGEVTLYPGGGFETFDPKEWDATLGTWLKLPTAKD